MFNPHFLPSGCMASSVSMPNIRELMTMTRPIPFLGIAGVSIKATLSSHNHGSKDGCI